MKTSSPSLTTLITTSKRTSCGRYQSRLNLEEVAVPIVRQIWPSPPVRHQSTFFYCKAFLAMNNCCSEIISSHQKILVALLLIIKAVQSPSFIIHFPSTPLQTQRLHFFPLFPTLPPVVVNIKQPHSLSISLIPYHHLHPEFTHIICTGFPSFAPVKQNCLSPSLSILLLLLTPAFSHLPFLYLFHRLIFHHPILSPLLSLFTQSLPPLPTPITSSL